MRLDLGLFVKLKKMIKHHALSVGIKYFLRDLLFDVNKCLIYKMAICVT